MKVGTKLEEETDNSTTPAWARNESHEPGYRGFTTFDITEAKGMQGSKQRKGWLRFICPQCGERKLYIHSESGGWKCHKCNRGGGNWHFAAFVSGCPPEDYTGILSWLSSNLKDFNTLTGAVRIYPLKRFPEEFSRLQNLLIPNEPAVIYQPSIQRAVRSIIKAAIIQNIHFLSVSQKRDWVYLKDAELQIRLGFHSKSISRAMKQLLKKKYLEHNEEDGVDYYRINHANLSSVISRPRVLNYL